MQKSGYLGDDCVLLHFLSSVIERFSSRFASLVLIFLLAYFVNPEVAGLYSWMALTLTLTQAIVEVPLRQLAPEASSSDLGRAYISLRSKYGEYVSASLLTVTFLMLLLLAPDSHTLNVWQLLPMIGVPFFSVKSIRLTADFQVSGRWRQLAKLQVTSSLVASGITVTVLVLQHGLLGPALQPLLVEALYFALLKRLHTRGVGSSKSPSQTEMKLGHHERQWKSSVLDSSLSWAQSQLDRVLVGFVAGTSSLGHYSFGSAIGKTAGDTVSSAGSTVFRAVLFSKSPLGSLKSDLEIASIRAITLNGFFAIFLFFACPVISSTYLSSDWSPALSAAPIIALSTVASALSWHLTATLQALKSLRRSLLSRFTGIVLAVGIAFAASVSLTVAAWALVVRELVCLALLLIPARTYFPKRSVSLILAFVTVTWILVYVL